MRSGWISRRRATRLVGLLAVLAALAAVACRQVGYGDLHGANDLSGIPRDNTWLRAFTPETGDSWPPTGYLNLWVKGDDIGFASNAYRMNGFLFLVHTTSDCPQVEGGLEAFLLSQVHIAGVVTVANGSANQFVTIQDTPANRQPTWALIDIGPTPSTGGGHRIWRCGTVTWSP